MRHDLRYAVRALLKSPGFAAIAILSLGVGIGINTTIFTIVNAVLLRPLPVAHPERLVEIYTTSEVEHGSTSWLDYRDIRDQSDAFDGVAGHSLMFANISRDGQSRLVMGEVVSANYFDVLGVAAARGRTFAAGEDAADGANRLAVLGNAFWRREFGGDPSAIGRPLRVRGLDYTIIGIAPERFHGMTPGVSPDFWVPASMVQEIEPVGMNDVVGAVAGETRRQGRGQRWMFVTGRLKAGASIGQARASVSAIMSRLEREYPATNRNRRAALVPTNAVRIHPVIDGALLPAASLLMVAVGLVLLIACANIANMLLARATMRSREMAVRLAIGASRWRLTRQLLTESLLLATLGGWFGLLLARWSAGLIIAYQPPLPVSLTLDVLPDWRVFGFAAAASMLTGLAFGLAPALQAARPELVPALKNDPAQAGRTRRFGARNLLVVGQVAVCFVLLVAAGLLVRSLGAARGASVGFEPRGLALATVDLGMQRYSRERGLAFYRDAVARIRAIPGVTGAAVVERLPFSPNIHATNVYVEGRHYAATDHGTTVDSTGVGAGYFRTIGVPILRGRDFDERDTPTSAPAIIVNRAMAERLWPGQDPIGKRVRTEQLDGPIYEVVGEAGDHKVRTVGETARSYVHFANSQRYARSATLLARTSGDAGLLAQAIRREMLALEPDLTFIENQTMESAIGTTLYPARMGALMLSGAGGLALLLAAIGLYGVLAFSVSRRTREIGIRVALGAKPSRVLSLVIRQGMILVGVGILTGIGLSLALAQAISGALYGIPSIDVVTYLVATGVMLVVALAANLIPARRASRVDPMVALRTT
jgi:putative ABC transport system permease protein